MRQVAYPRYTRREGEIYTVTIPYIRKYNRFLATTKQNVKQIDYYLRFKSKEQIERYPYHFIFCAKNMYYDGLELSLKIAEFNIKNPHLLEQAPPIEIPYSISTILHVHHKDRNADNNQDSNLTTLCLFCHQSEHRMIFTPNF